MSINRKYIFKLLVIIPIIIICYVLFTQYKRRYYREFANNIVSTDILYEDIIHKQLLCNEKSNVTAKLILDYYRKNYKKGTNLVYVLSNTEVLFLSKVFGFDYNIVQEDKGLIYFIFINGNIFPILINEQNKIIAISTLQKGKRVYFIKC